MSAKIDVLAVMDAMSARLTAQAGPTSPAGPRNELRAARAAVAELIEAANAARGALKLARARWPMQPSPAQMPAYTAGQAALAQLDAALAKVQP